MSANKYYMLSADLVASVKRRASVPEAQSMVTDNEILEYANEEMLLNFIPLVLSQHEDYYLIREEVAITAGDVRYQIPYRAIGSKLREVAYKDTNGNLLAMYRRSVDDITEKYRHTTSTYPGNFHIEGEEVVLDINDDHNLPGTLVFFYSLRPNSLVDSSRVGVITSIDRVTGIIVFESLPDNIEATSQIDFIKTKAPHRVMGFDKSVVSVTAATNFMEVSPDDIPADLVVGDRVALAGETDILNAPSDLHVMLAQMTASRVLESIGDTEGLQAADKKLGKMENNAATIIANRVDGSPIKAKARNGTIRRGKYRRGHRSTRT